MSGIADKYRSHTHEEHILNVPDTYIGSVEPVNQEMYVVQESEDGDPKIVKKEIEYIPGLYKIFDEIVVNALDQYVRCNIMAKDDETVEKIKQIKFIINREDGSVEVYNDGKGIDIAMHPKHEVYVPHMIFGKLLTSTNYNKKEKKIVGGKNGYGAKLTNIYSTTFEIQTTDKARKLHYKQVFKQNMKNAGKPKIKEYDGKSYTKIKFTPEYSRFGCDGLTQDMYDLFVKRVYDCAALTDKSVSIFLNKKKISVKTFKQFASIHTGIEEGQKMIHEELSPNWEVALTTSDSFEQVSFVNCVATFKGGKHIDHFMKELCGHLITHAEKKHKLKLKHNVVKEQFRVFLNCKVQNPSFDSQTKEHLTTPYSRMGTKYEISKKFIQSVIGMGVLDQAIAISQAKELKNLTKNEGRKRTTIRGIPKLEDATFAGTAKSEKCTLILTEGDSAATTAISGLKVIGKDYYGVFPLRGKMINVREHSQSKVHANKEIQNLKKIIGLETGKKYTDVKSLRYGKVIVLTDQDHDGSHIKGLAINMFHYLWPELLDMNYVQSMMTPIVKATLGKQEQSFYTLQDYEKWQEETAQSSKWKVKYYKGLGTSSPQEARQYFKEMKLLHYIYNTNEDHERMLLAFSKEKVSDRKDWLKNYNRSLILDARERRIPVQDFIDKELIHFSNADNIRSIPNVIDGLKKSQRKVLFSCFKRDLKKEIRVAQLAGYVSEHSGYHHGEASLNGTIIKMAQNFVGSNNINLLQPIGQFGSRLLGGKDSASPRYIHTSLEKITSKIFKPADQPILEYLDDDGLKVEPVYYTPIIPMLLVNGSTGIGTGFSTNIPKFSVSDIIENIKRKIAGSEYQNMKPSYDGFKGDIIQASNTAHISKAVYRIEKDSVIITELPIGTWSQNYKIFLEGLIPDAPSSKKAAKCVKSIQDNYNDVDVYFKVTFYPGYLAKLTSRQFVPAGELELTQLDKYLKLYSLISTSNMSAFDKDDKLKEYSNWNEIMDEFYDCRLDHYSIRKKYQLNVLDKKIELISEKVRFIHSVITKKLKLMNEDDKSIEKQMGNDGLNFKKIDQIKEEDPLSCWNYLLSMHVRTLTLKKKEQLEKERDNLVRQRDILKSTSIQEIWTNELDDLKEEYARFIKIKNEYLANTKTEPINKGGKKIIRRRVKKRVQKK
jgi:DNA topoisomerase-2